MQRVAQRGDRTEQPEHDLLGHRDVHGGREGVVGGLRHVDVVVGMDGLLGAHDPAAELDGPVGDDLVGVHVGLRAAARLPDAQRELVVEIALGHLARRLLNEAGQRLVQLAEVAVDRGRGALEDPESPDQRLGHRLDADVEVVQGALGLGAPVAVGGDLDLPHAVAFDAGVRHGRQLRTGAAAPPASAGGARDSRAQSPLGCHVTVEQPDGGLPGRHAQLAQNGRHVAADRGRRDEQPLGDFGRAGALAHQLEHVPLAPGEPGRLPVGHGDPPVLAVTEFVDQAGHEGPGKHGLPGQHALQRVADGGLVQALEQIPRRAGPERVEEVLVLARHGEHDDRGVRQRAGDLRRGGNAVPRHVDVEQADVGPLALGPLDRAGGVGGFHADVEVPGALQRVAHQRPGPGVVVGQQDGDGRAHPNATATRVPALGHGVDAEHGAHRGRPLLHALEPEAPGGVLRCRGRTRTRRPQSRAGAARRARG